MTHKTTIYLFVLAVVVWVILSSSDILGDSLTIDPVPRCPKPCPGDSTVAWSVRWPKEGVRLLDSTDHNTDNTITSEGTFRTINGPGTVLKTRTLHTISGLRQPGMMFGKHALN